MFFLKFFVSISVGFYTISNNIYYVGVVSIDDTLLSKYTMYISDLLMTREWPLKATL